jgi:hypothetical protein
VQVRHESAVLARIELVPLVDGQHEIPLGIFSFASNVPVFAISLTLISAVPAAGRSVAAPLSM